MAGKRGYPSSTIVTRAQLKHRHVWGAWKPALDKPGQLKRECFACGAHETSSDQSKALSPYSPASRSEAVSQPRPRRGRPKGA